MTLGSKILLGILIIPVLWFLSFILMFVIAFGGIFDKNYSKEELSEHFKTHQTEFNDLTKYIKTITPKNKEIYANFENNEKEQESIKWLKSQGLTTLQTSTLKQKLEKINSLGFYGGNPLEIEFQRSGIAMISFIIFDKPLITEQENKPYKSCNFIIPNQVFIDKDAGAVGGTCINH